MHKIKRILFITLSNIGDVILTLPVLDTLKEYFPHAEVVVVSGPRAAGIFQNNPYISRYVIFDKHARLREKIKLFYKLSLHNFDLVVDLRNSFFGIFLPARFSLPWWRLAQRGVKHMSQRHLYLLIKLLLKIKAVRSREGRETALFVFPQDKVYIKNIFAELGGKKDQRLIIISAGARSQIKRWPKERFAELISRLGQEFPARVVLVGDKDDQPVARYISEKCASGVIDLTGKTSLTQLAYLFKMAHLLITNDSASLHLASYLNIPVVAVFGPTDEEKYGPWSDRPGIVKKDISCRPCSKAQCSFAAAECMSLVKVDDVLRQVRNVFSNATPSSSFPRREAGFKRILVVRSDRIGDVILSTPVIKALRDAYPHAFIAIMVSPYAREIVEGNVYLDQVIVYDKDGLHKSWFESMRFARRLKTKRFDLAIVLHPTNRAHLITYFAGIPRRVGYKRKLGFLLTDALPHTKQLGQKHEVEYALDLVRYLGIEPKDKLLYMPIKIEAERWTEALFAQEGIKKEEKILAIHPGASCKSKLWPAERFALVADRLMQNYGFKTIVIGGPQDIRVAEKVVSSMHLPALNLAGRTSVSQLASLFIRSRLFISNDSGPVHIATAVGLPVISIFGRSQLGLSPKRWGPVGEKDKALHKEAGCIECLAHNCKKDFICLKAISPEDVYEVAESILSTLV